MKVANVEERRPQLIPHTPHQVAWADRSSPGPASEAMMLASWLVTYYRASGTNKAVIRD